MSGSNADIVCPAEAWEDTPDDVDALLETWSVSVGDHVSAGETVAAVIVVKTTFDIVAPGDGEISEILVDSGETFGRDAVLAVMRIAAAA